ERVDELEDADHVVVVADHRDREDRARPVVVRGVEGAVEAVLDVLLELVDVVDIEDLARRGDVARDRALRDRQRPRDERRVGTRLVLGLLALVARVVLRGAEDEVVALARVEAARVAAVEAPRLLEDHREEAIEVALLPGERRADRAELADAI